MASAAAAAPAADLAPNQTLYVNNLNEKVKRGELKKTLYANFSQFGRVMQIICKGSFRLKGQAWVVFDEITAAAAAKRQLHNVPLLGKPLHVQFAKEKSKVATRLTSAAPGRAAKRPRDDGEDGAGTEEEPSATRPALQSDGTTLVVSGLPADAGQERLAELFVSFPGFRGARLPPGGKGVGFVDFDDASKADAAGRAMHGFSVGEGASIEVKVAGDTSE